MKVIVTAESLGECFERAHWSLWEDAKTNSMSVAKQKAGWRKKFKAKVSGGHFDNSPQQSADDSQNAWNTRDAIVEFRSKADYVLFMLEWS